ncbi:MAG: methionine biosynthesis protein MetW [Actinobacteria bacterium]|nr:methionine biosynthesis protein MetW [Actinomycetota bacterium]
MRPDLDVIASLVPPGARVLDLGCGDGALLEELMRRGNDVLGVEISDDGVLACMARGVPVLQDDIDEGLGDLADDAFDIVIMSLTLQAVRNPALILREMHRVAGRGIVSFPNFGHWRLRAQLAAKGRMPVSPLLPYAWHETPNIRLCSITDFEALAGAEGFRVEQRILLDDGGRPVGGLSERAPNLLAAGVVYLLNR